MRSWQFFNLEFKILKKILWLEVQGERGGGVERKNLSLYISYLDCLPVRDMLEFQKVQNYHIQEKLVVQ